MTNNNGNRNRNQDQFRTRDRDWQNRNQGNRDYEDDRNRNRYSDPGNFKTNYGGAQYGGTYNSDWNDDFNQNENMGYNRSNRGDDLNKSSYRGSDYRSGSSEYGRPYDSSRGNTGDYDRNERSRRGERDWWDRTSDEVSSWFGDDDAERRRRMDKMNGPHRGKGPKGYTRSDDKIRDDINDKLYHDSYIDAGDIDVTVSNGDVTLTGNVDSRDTKRRAEDLAEEVTGVNNVSNNLKVNKSSSGGWSSTQTDTSKTTNKDLAETSRRN